MVLPWRLKKWDGDSWENAELRKWNGSSFSTVNGYYWDGSSWVLLTDRTPPTTTQTKQYTPAWHRSWRNGGGTIRSDSNGLNRNYQGSVSDSNGLQMSTWGFPTTLHTDIDGAAAYYYAQVFITNLHTWFADGGTAVLGTTDATSAPATFDSNRNGVVASHFDQGQAKWVNLGTQFCNWADGGSFYGLNLYANDTNVEYYGYYTTSVTYEHSFER